MLPPLTPGDWSPRHAAHLLNRAGFGGPPAQIRRLYEAGFDPAVEKLIHGEEDSSRFPMPAWMRPRNLLELKRQRRGLSDEEKKMQRRAEDQLQPERIVELTGWWLNRMLQTSHPLREKMTLFWHGHFATSMRKVKDAYLMGAQNQTLRNHALGNFKLMTKAMSRDPAMMIWLDTDKSQRRKPNENFSRELLELFTLGIGNYTEQDVREAARAFTGYRIDLRDQSFRFSTPQHDFGVKKLFGKTGSFDGDEVVSLLVAMPECARLICRKLWEFFAYEEPEEEIISALAGIFRDSNYEVQPVLAAIFRSAPFYSQKAVRTQIKSPVQWMVQTAAILETKLPETKNAVKMLKQLGQTPFAPPNVKGWEGGKAWITTSTLLFRYNFASFALGENPLKAHKKPERKKERRHSPLDFEKIAPSELRGAPTELGNHLAIRLFQQPLTQGEQERFVSYLAEQSHPLDETSISHLLHLMMSTPQYQLT